MQAFIRTQLTIQRTARRWLPRRREERRAAAAAAAVRYDAVMRRHRERMQQLEREKRRVAAIPSAQLEEADAARCGAAARIQAAWRGFARRRAAAAAGEAGVQQQIDARVQASRLGLGGRGAAAGVGASGGGGSSAGGSPGDALDCKLERLLADWEGLRGQRLAAAMQRQQTLHSAEVLSAQLRDLPALAALQPAGPAAPPRLDAAGGGGGRDARGRACQGHALALAEAQVGSKWWLALRRLGGGGGSGGEGAEAVWAQEDQAWRRGWERILKEEAGRIAV
ncbi:MAG: hypothetical protein J3K34DRAFT_515951 [Monoraphidium minutum]|nr:MAG: hypothetical protein J3K34DRAFT_515951 [Monoraphidium minutum]